MKQKLFFFSIAFLLTLPMHLQGEVVVFTKQDSADWTLPENQDRITNSVWITRKHNQGIFNIAQETGYSGNGGSPLGTLWAGTSTADAESDDFTSFLTMHGGSPQSLVNDTISLYLEEYGRYFDLVFLSFSGGNSGGGFSYSREEVFPTHLGTVTIEGRWIAPLYEGDPGNTMYEYLDGLRYTYYCADDNECDSTYWNSLDTSDAIPNPNPYTLDGNTISIDLFFGNIATYELGFRCDGQVVDFYYDEDDNWEGFHSTMFRVGFDDVNSECDSIEGRWISEYYSNTMYEFDGQNRLTYYCVEDTCDSTYWSSLDTSDAIPERNPYTFINDTLTIDLYFGNIYEEIVTFLCDGNVIDFNSQQSNLHRIGTDFEDCDDYNGQQLELSYGINKPEKFRLNQNYPNPFNPVTNISYDLSEESYVSITIYDMMGNVINNLVKSKQSSGFKSLQWNSTNNQGQPVSAGVYLYTIEAGDFRQTKKMILLK